MTGLVAVVAALAVYRITMLVTADEITEPLRERITARYVHPVHEYTVHPDAQDGPNRGDEFYAECRCRKSWQGPVWSDVVSEMNGHLGEERRSGIEMTEGPRWTILLSCPWCVSVHIGMIVMWTAWNFGGRSWWFVPASALAASAATGILSTFASPSASH